MKMHTLGGEVRLSSVCAAGQDAIYEVHAAERQLQHKAPGYPLDWQGDEKSSEPGHVNMAVRRGVRKRSEGGKDDFNDLSCTCILRSDGAHAFVMCSIYSG